MFSLPCKWDPFVCAMPSFNVFVLYFFQLGNPVSIRRRCGVRVHCLCEVPMAKHHLRTRVFSSRLHHLFQYYSALQRIIDLCTNSDTLTSEVFGHPWTGSVLLLLRPVHYCPRCDTPVLYLFFAKLKSLLHCINLMVTIHIATHLHLVWWLKVKKLHVLKVRV
jgi:hypothetical protein